LVEREEIKEIGYDNIERGLDYKNAVVMVALDKQS
jgi:S-adenosylmethionine synthetase